ncbi:IclR family transcriptional regulator [Micromonospora sp. NPDC050397]|uniref:IclR family transcriptional regulator n=1 Tax=Micromonospora sp. NPDC050397 TaxID=3364279 RepID=UPI00384F3D47
MRTAERNIPHMAVARVSALLDAFDEQHRELRVCELARRAGLPKSTTSRLVADLVTYGLLERDGPLLRVGGRLVEFGELAVRGRDLRAVARPYLADLCAATTRTAHLAVLRGTEVVYLETVRAHDARPEPSHVDGRLPAHACAAGKALLAYGGEAAVALVCGRPLEAVGPRTVTAPDLLRRQLARIRESGLAYEDEECQAGFGSVASPVLRADRAAAAAICLSGPVGRLDLRAMGPAVRTVALAVGRAL